MLYRYRLSEHVGNAGLKSRSLDGIILHKNRWWESLNSIDWGIFSELVEGESADSHEDFLRKQAISEKGHREEIRKKVQENQAKRIAIEPVVEPEPVIEEVIVEIPELDEPDFVQPDFIPRSRINKMRKKELQGALSAWRIPEEEYKDLKVVSLRDLLWLAQEVTNAQN